MIKCSLCNGKTKAEAEKKLFEIVIDNYEVKIRSTERELKECQDILCRIKPQLTRKDKRRLKEIDEEIGAVFEIFNKELCSNCPVADKKKGCCHGCASSGGHFRTFPRHHRTKIDALKKKYRFTPLHGFFNSKQKTCKLPRSERSSVCLRYCCDHRLEDHVRPLVAEREEIRKKYNLLY